MLRSLVIVVGLLAGFQTALAAPWELPTDVKTLTVNGYPIAYRERGSGPTVLLLHGQIGDYRGWNGLLKSPPAGFRFMALSRRHHYPERWDGKGGQFSTKQHTEDLAAFIEALGVGPVHVVAPSLAGIFAVRAAQARPDLVKKLVLMEGAFGALLPPSKPAAGGISLPKLRKAAAARFEEGDIDGGLEMWIDRFELGTWKRLSEPRRQVRRDNAWLLLTPLGPGTRITCSDVAGLSMPVLLMQGEKTTPRYARIVEATQKCLPSAEHVIIPEAEHGTQIAIMNPSAFQATLVTFLKK